MRTVFMVAVDSDEETKLEDYTHCVAYLQDLLDRHIAGEVTIIPVDPDRYDGDPKNEVADLSTDSHIVTCEECVGLKEDYVYADWESGGGSRKLSVEGPISWVLPILRAANGINSGDGYSLPCTD